MGTNVSTNIDTITTNDNYENLIMRAKLSLNPTPFAILKICVPDNLKIKYIEAIKEHNNKMEKNIYPDSGFDLYLSDNFNVSEKYFAHSNTFLFNGENNTVNSFKIDFEIKCEMQTFMENGNYSIPSAFFLFPRSSISKTPIRLANSIGLIDSGYRGNIIGAFDYINKNSTLPFELKKYDRIVQIVHPNTYRIFVELVDELTDSERGAGAFGSTGKGIINKGQQKTEFFLDTVPTEIKMNL
jgi:dUTP pyrophosphatase